MRDLGHLSTDPEGLLQYYGTQLVIVPVIIIPFKSMGQHLFPKQMSAYLFQDLHSKLLQLVSSCRVCAHVLEGILQLFTVTATSTYDHFSVLLYTILPHDISRFSHSPVTNPRE